MLRKWRYLSPSYHELPSRDRKANDWKWVDLGVDIVGEAWSEQMLEISSAWPRIR